MEKWRNGEISQVHTKRLRRQGKLRSAYMRSDSMFSGNIRRFRRVCEHIQSQVCSGYEGMLRGQRRAAPPSPQASRKFATEMSESSSCGSDTSERLFLSPHPATRQVVCFNKVAHHPASHLNHSSQNNSYTFFSDITIYKDQTNRLLPHLHLYAYI